jgi:hypothetical protein
MVDRTAAAPFHRFCPKIRMRTTGMIRVEDLNGSQIPSRETFWGTDSWKHEHPWPNFETIFVGTFSIRFPRNLRFQIEDSLESGPARLEKRSFQRVWHQGFGFRVDLDWFGYISTQSEKYFAFTLSISRIFLQSALWGDRTFLILRNGKWHWTPINSFRKPKGNRRRRTFCKSFVRYQGPISRRWNVRKSLRKL